MPFKTKDLGKLFKKTFKEWNAKDPFRQSAVIAYYAIFSIPGLLVLVIAIAGYFFGKDAVNESILSQVASTLGEDTSLQIKQILAKATQTKSTLWGSIIGVGTILLGATGVFVELQITLNAIWKVKVVPKKGILPILKARLFSFGLILAIAFLLMISLVISTALAAISDFIKGGTSEFMIIVFNVLNFIFSLAVISMLFALMYKILPDAKIQWKHVWFGAILTGLLFTIGKTVLAFYFGTAQPASIYGTAGSIILILLWVSYSSMILFFGAEFTAAYAKQYTGEVPPTEIAKAEIPIKTQ
ncbi:YihY/virulence factor BrkB family protein [Emticicia sp.]|uniref:YihY/virulence factor BrkB family protein n=1 Tax=Emticicia sp. TaxID=1930953 RepID=UPI003752893F